MSYPTSYRRAGGPRGSQGSRLSRRGSLTLLAFYRSFPGQTHIPQVKPKRHPAFYGFSRIARLHYFVRLGIQAYEFAASRLDLHESAWNAGPGWYRVHKCEGRISHNYEHEYSTCNILLHLWKPGVTPEPGPGPLEFATKWTQHLYWFNGIVVGNHTYYLREKWWLDKPTDGQEAYPPRLRAIPKQAPALAVAVDPFLMPVEGGLLEPEPIPYRLRPHRQPNPFRSPSEQSHRGYDASEDFGGAPDAEQALPFRVRQPAAKGTREAKIFVAMPIFAQIITGAVTETGDFIDALHDALPKHAQYFAIYGNRFFRDKWKKDTHARFIARKANLVWTYFDLIDWKKAGNNIVRNEIIDQTGGFVGRKAKRAAQKMRLTHGLQLGPLF